MYIVATFTGTNYSLGYLNGKSYMLKIEGSEKIKIEPVTGVAKPCIYNSVTAFLSNWNNVQSVL